jgi:V8-like Glu-specific endopeptidase
MRITLRSRVVAIAAVSVLILSGAALLPRTIASVVSPAAGAVAAPSADVAAQSPGATHSAGAEEQAAAVRYWTPAKMSAVLQRARNTTRALTRTRQLVKQAAPAAAPWLAGDTAGDGLRWTHGGAVAAAVGKVFFTLSGSDYVCSGTLVGSGRSEVVLTAAHCVAGAPGRARWATNWLFVPGYRDGQREPYGEYTARRLFTAPGWAGPQGGTEQYDVAFVQVTSATLDGGARAAVPPPGLPVEFAGSQDGAAAGRGYVFGYPAEPPFTGLYANFCAGPFAASGGSVRTACAMTAGDSGGPWLTGFSPRTGAGRVFAVSTYKLSTNLKVLYGAVLGPQAHAAYQRAVSTAG